MSTEKKFKRGDSHPSGDGRVFWRYDSPGAERWLSKASYDDYVNNHNASRRKSYLIPECREKKLAYNRQWAKGYTQNRRKNDYMFDMKARVIDRTAREFKDRGWNRSVSIEVIVGCDWHTLCKILEQRFLEGMTWENRSKWHIDHRIPLCSALNVEELCKLCHHDNLYPLWAFDNKRKGGRIIDNSTKHFSF